MRILVWYWSGGGGGSQFAAHLAKRLALQFGVDSIVLSMRADDPTLKRAQADGVQTLAAPIVSDRYRPLASISALAQAAKVLREHARGSDIVVIPMNFAVAAPLSFTLNRAIVYCAHDPEPHPGDYARIGQRLTQNALLQRADAVVALSEFAARRLRSRRSVATKLRVAPLASVFPPRARPPRREGPTRLLFCGRMINYKGVALLADAVERIAGRGDWRLTVAGAGPALTDAMRARLVSLGADVRAAWHSENDLDVLMCDHDIVLAPYIEASQSGVVADALRHGRPCVVTPVGALSEQIGAERAGWLAAAASAADFADAILAALNDPVGRVQRGEAAAARAAAAYQDDAAWGWLTQMR